MRPVSAVIEAEGLVRQFGRQRAADGLELRIERGDVFGALRLCNRLRDSA